MFAEPVRNQDIAAAFLKQQPPYSLVCNEGRWYRRGPSCGWRYVPPEKMETILSRFTARFLDLPCGRNGKPLPGTSYTASRVKDILDCLRVKVSLLCDDEPTLDPAMFFEEESGDLVARSAPGWIATESHHLDVAGVAQAMYRNGEIPAGMLRDADARLFSPGCVPCRFDPEATCPRWERFIREVCPDDAKTLQMMFGLSLTYDRRFNVFFLVHGEAGTGKSTALNILARLSAGVTSNVSLSQFGERFQDYALTHNRVNLVHDMDAVSEIGTGVTRRESVLKSCTCGEILTVEQKNQNPEQRHLSALPVFGCNTLPRFADRSNAIGDRMRIVRFPNVFRNTDAQDNNLCDTLEAELSGILNWALRGLGELLASGARVFPESESARLTKIEAIKASRPEELFCDEYLELDTGGYLLSTLVYDHYHRYCVRSGFRPADINSVTRDIAAYLGVVKDRKSTTHGRKTCIFDVAFQEWVLKHSEYPG